MLDTLMSNGEVTMIRNVGSWDRLLRIVVGAALIVMTLMGTIGIWGWIGVIPLATGLAGRCPLYGLLGMNTCPMRGKEV